MTYKYKKVVNKTARLSFDLSTLSSNVGMCDFVLPADVVISRVIGFTKTAIIAGTATSFKLQYNSTGATTWADITGDITISGLASSFVPTLSGSLTAKRIQGYNELRLLANGTITSGIVDFYIEYFI